ncbi:MAG: DUF927 domain-containing protein [Gammaproteobacteria bacterium]|nr:DUF927 domain-containing protein [Gammaproteobacteria bacterium]
MNIFDAVVEIKADLNNSVGTEGTERTTAETGDSSVPLTELIIGNAENNLLSLIPIDPIEHPPENLVETEIRRPSYVSHADWFILNDKKYPPGLYWHNEYINKDKELIQTDEWISNPLSVKGSTCSIDGSNFGRLLKFRDTNNKWHEWAMPMYLLSGSGEDLRKELLDQGLVFNTNKRARILEYIMQERPKRKIIAATKTGWHGDTFVLPNCIIGDADVVYQNEHVGVSEYSSAGNLRGWQDEIATYCQDNIPLMLSVSAALAGALLKRIQRPGGGIHWKGDSSSGKSTAVEVAASIWGPPEFVKSWSATANGIEGSAAARNDTCLILDEIDQALPQEVGKISYMLVNGQGKQRASKIGNACKVQQWRLMTISTGERTLTEIMAEIGKRPNAGQLVRLLSIPASFSHGSFSNLHDLKDGRSFADYLKQARTRNYGHAGEAFIRGLINDPKDLGEAVSQLEDKFASTVKTNLEKRAAAVFAWIALAGELAIEYAILPWQKGSAIHAAQIGFERWRKDQGEANTEDQQILHAILDFIDKHASSRFSSKLTRINDRAVINRAGWYDEDDNSNRVYYLTSSGLKDAGAGFDLNRIVQAIDKAGWIIEHDKDRKTKKIRTPEGLKNLYYIRITEVN